MQMRIFIYLKEGGCTVFLKKLKRHLMEYGQLHLKTLPSVILLILFAYLPKFGVIVAFQNFKLIWQSLCCFKVQLRSIIFYLL